MQLVIGDNGRNVILFSLSGYLLFLIGKQTHPSDGSDFWKIASSQASPTRSSDDVVCRVFVDICCLLAGCFDDLKDGVHLEPIMRVLQGAFPIHNYLGEMSWIDTTTEEFGGVVVKIFGRVGYGIVSMFVP